MATVPETRERITRTLFPNGIPRLWCPLLTHYRGDGSLDTERIAAHIRSMRPWVSAFLAPGSTGDGWEMDEEEADALLGFLAAEAVHQEFMLMIGVLRTRRGAVVPAVNTYLERFTDGRAEPASLASRRICGFTVTPPAGRSLEQGVIRAELEAIARTGVPLAIYQLPQVTENEMSPGTVADLASAYPNIYLMKDTSGEDRVARARPELGNLFLVRGAEGEYASWLRESGGLYNGFLLSTANSFARELGTMIRLVEEGRQAEADELSRRVSAAVAAVFEEAGALPYGNPFANANKAFDHHFAWGPEAGEHDPPMTHSGSRLPRSLVTAAGEALAEQRFDPGAGYMSSQAAS